MPSRGEGLESEFALRLSARSRSREQGIQQVKHRGRLARSRERKRQRLCGRRGFEEAQLSKDLTERTYNCALRASRLALGTARKMLGFAAWARRTTAAAICST